MGRPYSLDLRQRVVWLNRIGVGDDDPTIIEPCPSPARVFPTACLGLIEIASLAEKWDCRSSRQLCKPRPHLYFDCIVAAEARRVMVGVPST
jgi:hypothetical protein